MCECTMDFYLKLTLTYTLTFGHQKYLLEMISDLVVTGKWTQLNTFMGTHTHTHTPHTCLDIFLT